MPISKLKTKYLGGKPKTRPGAGSDTADALKGAARVKSPIEDVSDELRRAARAAGIEPSWVDRINPAALAELARLNKIIDRLEIMFGPEVAPPSPAVDLIERWLGEKVMNLSRPEIARVHDTLRRSPTERRRPTVPDGPASSESPNPPALPN